MNYNDIYYIMSPDFSTDKYEIEPEEETALRCYDFREMEESDGALEFALDDQDIMESKPRFLFSTPSFFISKELKPLFEGAIYGGKLYPVTIQGNKGEYFLINTYQELDCWCRESSEFELISPESTPHVTQYRLDSSVLDSISEHHRLVFKMGGDSLSPMIVHQSIKEKLEQVGVDNINFFQVGQYSLGNEY